MNRALIAGMVLLAGLPLQMKYPKACDHAAPPEGMRWVCANENPCDCHLEASTSEDQGDENPAKSNSVKATGSFLPCRIEFFVIPAYPEAARQAQKQGIVSATLILAPDGNVGDVRLESGEPQLAAAVQAAMQQWRFTPGNRPESIPVSVKFVLSDSPAGAVSGTTLLNAVVTAKPVR